MWVIYEAIYETSTTFFWTKISAVVLGSAGAPPHSHKGPETTGIFTPHILPNNPLIIPPVSSFCHILISLGTVAPTNTALRSTTSMFGWLAITWSVCKPATCLWYPVCALPFRSRVSLGTPTHPDFLSHQAENGFCQGKQGIVVYLLGQKAGLDWGPRDLDFEILGLGR